VQDSVVTSIIGLQWRKLWGLASAIVTLVTLIGQFTKLSYVFLSDIRKASKSQKMYLQEIPALTEVLLRIEQALGVQELVAARPSPTLERALRDCQELLMSLETSLRSGTASGSRMGKVTSSLTWLFDEKEVKKILEIQCRYR
jgi:hypothetical protein